MNRAEMQLLKMMGRRDPVIMKALHHINRQQECLDRIRQLCEASETPSVLKIHRLALGKLRDHTRRSIIQPRPTEEGV